VFLASNLWLPLGGLILFIIVVSVLMKRFCTRRAGSKASQSTAQIEGYPYAVPMGPPMGAPMGPGYPGNV